MNRRELAGLPAIHTTARAVAGTLVFCLLAPWLFSKGMFWDGVVYGSVARNLAQGVGDAWHLSVSATFMRHFHEHPPLAYWLQVPFFRILGDHFWVERVYGLAAALVTLPILLGVWRYLLRDNPQAAPFSWLAIVFWAPFGAWCYRHNMLENTLGIFTAISIYASLRAVESTRIWAAWSALAGAAIAAAVLCKGPVGLFPAVTPAIAWITLRRTSFARALCIELVVLASVAGSFGIVLIPEASREYLAVYWHQQIVASVLGHREGVSSLAGHFNILRSVARELAIPVLVAGSLQLLARRRTGPMAAGARLVGPTWFCLLTALSASVPLTLSPKQAGHYAAPSWPYYAFAVALWCVPAAADLLSRVHWLAIPRWHQWLRCCAGAIVITTALISALNYGRCLRDASLIETADQLAREVSAPATVVVSTRSWRQLPTTDQLKLHAYCYRYHSISLFADEAQPAFRLECHRLERPDSEMVASPRSVKTSNGLDCRALVPRGPSRVASEASPVIRR